VHSISTHYFASQLIKASHAGDKLNG